MSQALEIIKRSHLGFKLSPISLRELLFIEICPTDIYGIKIGQFQKILRKGDHIRPDVLRALIKQGQANLYILGKYKHSLVKGVQRELIQTTRSFSVGNPLEKVKKQMNLLTIHLQYVYNDPTDDELLQLHYQCVKNLAYFLMNKMDFHESLYQNIIGQRHHYVFAQPLISSLFLLGILKYSRLFGDKEIETLFVTSYFKDIGMSSIPTKKYDSDELSEQDKIKLSRHAEHSVQILKGRLPISPAQLRMISGHHSWSLIGQDIDLPLEEEEDDQIHGLESTLITAIDVIAAMITERPYRKADSLFQALSNVRIFMADQYPQEFKLTVNYFRNFFNEK